MQPWQNQESGEEVEGSSRMPFFSSFIAGAILCHLKLKVILFLRTPQKQVFKAVSIHPLGKSINLQAYTISLYPACFTQY